MDGCESNSEKSHRLRISQLCSFISFDRSLIKGLTQYINEHEHSLNNTEYLEDLLLVIEGPDTLETHKQFSQTLYRIITRTNIDMEPALSFQASVNLQLLLFWAEHKGWDADRKITS